jgi:hypothetical protein
VEALVQRIMDEGKDKFPPIALEALALRTGKSTSRIQQELESYGLNMGSDPVFEPGRYESTSKTPEYTSIGNFVRYLLDDERGEFTASDLQALNGKLRKSVPAIRKELEALGFGIEDKGPEKRPRGYNCNDHDRWYGPGSCPSHGGSGFDRPDPDPGRELPPKDMWRYKTDFGKK